MIGEKKIIMNGGIEGLLLNIIIDKVVEMVFMGMYGKLGIGRGMGRVFWNVFLMG